jgi:hypothetical protein
MSCHFDGEKREDGQTYFVGVQKDVTLQVKAQQRLRSWKRNCRSPS